VLSELADLALDRLRRRPTDDRGGGGGDEEAGITRAVGRRKAALLLSLRQRRLRASSVDSWPVGQPVHSFEGMISSRRRAKWNCRIAGTGQIRWSLPNVRRETVKHRGWFRCHDV